MARPTLFCEDRDVHTPRQKSLFESRREREFYRYYEPIRALTETGPQLRDVFGPNPQAIGSPDAALTAFCQLGALRMATRRALLFFFDQSYAYVLAEATRSLSLLDDSIEDTDDDIWLGHSKIPRGHSVCEYTTLNMPNQQGNYQNETGDLVHIISDLSEDTAFCDRPFVVGGPKARFYAGVPITTSKGINIGAYCLLDDKPREGLKPSETRFLRHMAMTVMKHLEMVRAKAQMERGNRMVAGLGDFVEGASDPVRGLTEGREGGHHSRSSSRRTKRTSRRPRMDLLKNDTPIAGDERVLNAADLAHQLNAATLQSSPAEPQAGDEEKTATTDNLDSQTPLSSAEKSPGSRQQSRPRAEEFKAELVSPIVRKTFARAAVVVRDAVEVDGAIFYDASIGSYGNLVGRSNSSDNSEREQGTSSPNEDREQEACTVLGASYRRASKDQPDARAKATVSEGLIRRLLKRYPQGKIWNFNAHGSTSSDDDSREDGNVHNALQRKRDRKRSQLEDGRRIAHHFPGVRSLGIVGLWDQRTAKWFAACVVFSFSPFRIPAYELEISFLQAFGDVVMAEVHRLEAQKSDRQKLDFISSISHELRSPLHGILGTIECLREVITKGSTLDLVSQVEVCGRTLLDIVNHLLDHSKINYYGGGVRKGLLDSQNSRNKATPAGGAAPQLGSTDSLISAVSLDQLTEQVVDTTLYSFCCSRDRKITLARKVDMILDIDRTPGIDWRCWLAVGGWTRVIVNLVSNALKYTNAGYIHVSLGAIKGDTPDTFNAVLTVRDSGCGMSKAFIRDRLFLPFAQENSLVEGTGLGLNLVANIIKALNGKIDVQSEQNVGTTVTAMITLEKTQDASELPESVADAALSKLPGSISLAMPGVMDSSKIDDINGQGMAQTLLFGCIVRLCSQMNVRTLNLSDEDSRHANVHLDFEERMRPSLSQLRTSGKGADAPELLSVTPLIVVCKDAISAREFQKLNCDVLRHRHLEVIAQPVGHERLSKAVRACMATVAPAAKPGAARVEGSNSFSAAFSMPTAQINVPHKPGSATVEKSDPFSTAFSSSAPQTSVPQYSKPAVAATLSPKDAALPGRPADHTPPRRGPLVRSISDTKTPAATNLTLLLVDDNAINLQLLSTYTHRHGHNQIAAHNGEQAVAAYKAACLGQPLPSSITAIQNTPSSKQPVARIPAKPRVVLMDINMPILNGFEATRQIRQFEREYDLVATKVIALTGLGSASAQQEAYSSGIDLFLTKPVRLRELTAILEGLEKE